MKKIKKNKGIAPINQKGENIKPTIKSTESNLKTEKNNNIRYITILNQKKIKIHKIKKIFYIFDLVKTNVSKINVFGNLI